MPPKRSWFGTQWIMLAITILLFVLVAFFLALPVALIVFVSFLDPWSPLGPFWDTAPIAGPMALVSTWAGIVAPRLLIPSLRPGSWPVAA